MEPSERALASVLDGEETLEEAWTVDTITSGFEFSPPGLGGTETIGLTDRRLVWLDDDLEAVDLERIRAVGIDAVGRSTTSLLLVTGPIATVLGAIVTILLWVVASLPTAVTVAPLAIGVFVLLAAVAGSRLQDTEDIERQYYLDVKTTETTVQVYATESTVESMNERITASLE